MLNRRSRKYHILAHNSANLKPYRLIFYDTEADLVKESKSSTRHHFKMASACFVRLSHDFRVERERWLTTDKQEDLLDFIVGNVFDKTNLYVLAHNQNYDMILANVFEGMKERGFEVGKMIVDSQRVIVTFKNDTRKIIFLDTLNFFKTALKNLGESINLPKLEMPSKNASAEDWNNYNKRDVEILKEYFIKYLRWLREKDLGNFAYTIASQSFNAYRHRFMQSPIHIHDNYDALALERDGYFGGRTECFKIGSVDNENIYYLDINSMYPFVMAFNRYPMRLLGRLYSTDIPTVRKKLKDYSIVARCVLNTDQNAYPYRYNEKLCFPVGEFETTLSTPEIQYAIENNHLLKIKDAYIYQNSFIFSEFVNYFYHEKEVAKRQNDTMSEKFFKLILNSLYGKFGQIHINWEEAGFIDDHTTGLGEYYDTVANKVRTVRYVMGKMIVEGEREESNNSFPAIAAHVTAFARIYLYETMRKAGLDNVFYCDTDSIFVNEDGYTNLEDQIDPYQLGKLKLEETANHMEIYGLKDYVFGEKKRVKGISKKWRQIDSRTYEAEYFPKIRSMINEGNLSNYYTFKIMKKLSRMYDKGIINKDGRVTPLVFPLKDDSP